MINFKEKYKILYESVKDIPAIQLEVPYPRGDDCSSNIINGIDKKYLLETPKIRLESTDDKDKIYTRKLRRGKINP